jgi:hypothetical protein
MRCNIVLDDRSHGGIIEKIAIRLNENLNEQGVFSKIINKPTNDVDVNHFMMYYYAEPIALVKNTMFITHVDFDWKLESLKEKIKYVDKGICMSRMTMMRLADEGIPKKSLCYVPPGHDSLVKPRKIKIGITSNLYNDGRKREWMLLELSKETWARNFQFEIYGKGWARVGEQMRCNGVEVNLYQGGEDYQKDYEEVLKAIPYFDYYLYLGLDEGSMGTLDALAAGVPLIVTTEGFHMDLNVKIDHPFLTYKEFLSILQRLFINKNNRTSAAATLSWQEYAIKHISLWEKLCFSKNKKNQTVSKNYQNNTRVYQTKKTIQYLENSKNHIIFYNKIRFILLRKYIKSDFNKMLSKILFYPSIVKRSIRENGYSKTLYKSIHKITSR